MGDRTWARRQHAPPAWTSTGLPVSSGMISILPLMMYESSLVSYTFRALISPVLYFALPSVDHVGQDLTPSSASCFSVAFSTLKTDFIGLLGSVWIGFAFAKFMAALTARKPPTGARPRFGSWNASRATRCDSIPTDRRIPQHPVNTYKFGFISFSLEA